MTDVERGELDEDKEDESERRWVVCEPVWQVVANENADEPVRRELIPGVNEVAAWRAEREAARRMSGVENRRQRRAE